MTDEKDDTPADRWNMFQKKSRRERECCQDLFLEEQRKGFEVEENPLEIVHDFDRGIQSDSGAPHPLSWRLLIT